MFIVLVVPEGKQGMDLRRNSITNLQAFVPVPSWGKTLVKSGNSSIGETFGWAKARGKLGLAKV